METTEENNALTIGDEIPEKGGWWRSSGRRVSEAYYDILKRALISTVDPLKTNKAYLAARDVLYLEPTPAEHFCAVKVPLGSLKRNL